MTDTELAELLIPPEVRLQIGPIHPVLVAKLILQAYEIGRLHGVRETLESIKAPKKSSKPRKNRNHNDNR